MHQFVFEMHKHNRFVNVFKGITPYYIVLSGSAVKPIQLKRWFRVSNVTV